MAVLKPAGVLTMGDRTEDRSMIDLAREYLRRKYDKPGQVFVGVVHRLDRPVSGVLLLARTSKGASRLSEQFRQRQVRKIYHCLVEGRPPKAAGELTDHLAKQSTTNVSRVVASDADAAKLARLKYRVLRSVRGRSLLEVELLTGRSHQIRVQLASRGLPICGDIKYGSRMRLPGWMALHGASLTFEHPTRPESMTVVAPEPAEWQQFL